MTTHVIGLFSRVMDDNRPINTLKAAGFPTERINLLSRDQVVLDVFGRQPQRIVVYYAAGGAFCGLMIYGSIALLSSWLQSNLFSIVQLIQTGIDISGIVTGLIVGASLGIYRGISQLNEVASMYYQGRRMDGTLIDVRVNGKKAAQVKDVLERDGACDIRII